MLTHHSSVLHSYSASLPIHRYLKILAVDPSYHRLSIGTRLLESGIALADSQQKSIALEASPMGKPLYERMGFVAERFIHVDGLVYKGDRYELFMVRWAGGKRV